ncbi:hypothetical protein amb3987 [Paramagnetospirillum magneticum AMB-1]|uniref:Uncharacterized protein n=1 Tax=Paramagnetospirillum magneticum (strain ATCC 700264 / AMB-1) TaxID=342108 RepID=Q2W034_PARM1|nr:hypothetical protein amb3987 [Paramagnetospirillum magneticum AMB-1]
MQMNHGSSGILPPLPLGPGGPRSAGRRRPSARRGAPGEGQCGARAATIIVVAALVLLAAAPAQAGMCITQGETLSCTDAGETVILRGGEGVAYSKLAGRSMTIARDGQGNMMGLIGEQKLIIQKMDGVTVARFGNRKLICAEAGPGITLCK